MSTPREIELKLTVARKDLRRLRRVLARFGRPVTETLETVYYDTRGFALADRKIALRLRRAGTRWLQTLKLAQAESPLSERIEYEMPVAGARLELRRFADTPLPEILRAERLKIGPRFRTRFARSVWMTPDGAVEIALDVGAIEAGKRSEPIVELELELKAGGPERLWELVGELAGQGEAAIALLPRADSKAARGVALALGRTVVPIKANAAAFTAGLRAGMSADAALRALIGAGTMILLANAHGLRATDDPEFVHQARVAVRRMRSAIRLLRDDVAFPRHLATGLRQIGRELGPARDWEVFISQTLPVLDVHSAALTRTASRARSAALRAARAGLAGAAFGRLTQELLQWATAAAPASLSGAELATLAQERLGTARRRLRRAARHFAQQSADEQHRVRICVKRWRYAIDLFASGAGVQATAGRDERDRLEATQDALGELCDLFTARRLSAELKLTPELAHSLTAAIERRHRQCLARAETDLNAVMHALVLRD